MEGVGDHVTLLLQSYRRFPTVSGEGWDVTHWLPGISIFLVSPGAVLPAGAWYISYEGWHAVPWMCHRYSGSPSWFILMPLPRKPFPPFSDCKKHPFIFLAYLECSCLCEVFPNSPSMLKALISPCSVPLPTIAHDPSVPFSCTWICLPLKTVSAMDKGDIQFIFVLCSKYLLNEGIDLLHVHVIGNTASRGHLTAQNNTRARNCLFLWRVRMCTYTHIHTTHTHVFQDTV